LRLFLDGGPTGTKEGFQESQVVELEGFQVRGLNCKVRIDAEDVICKLERVREPPILMLTPDAF
jgi:hypothetical protein